jgi:hypothetical protein
MLSRTLRSDCVIHSPLERERNPHSLDRPRKNELLASNWRQTPHLTWETETGNFTLPP